MTVKRSFLPVLKCRCGYEGDDYYVVQNGQHEEAKCKLCEGHIKFLSKEDKYGTKEQAKQIWDKTSGRCCYCGDPLNPFEHNGYTIEHINPQAQGGGHEIDNLWPACKSCNSQKGKKTLSEYRKYMKELRGTPTHIFYFEILGCSSIGDILKKIF